MVFFHIGSFNLQVEPKRRKRWPSRQSSSREKQLILLKLAGYIVVVAAVCVLSVVQLPAEGCLLFSHVFDWLTPSSGYMYVFVLDLCTDHCWSALSFFCPERVSFNVWEIIITSNLWNQKWNPLVFSNLPSFLLTNYAINIVVFWLPRWEIRASGLGENEISWLYI